MITNKDLIDKVVDAANIKSTDTILELGSGFGTVTSRLVSVARKVLISESDANLAEESLKKFTAEGFTNVQYLSGGALEAIFPRFDICISHLPYSLSAPIIFKLIKHRPLWRTCVMFVQREFADALIADPGERNYTRLSMNTSIFFRTERITRVNGACFYPVPPIESALVRLTPRVPPPRFDFDEFNSLVKTVFIEKKRNLKYIFSRPSVEKQLEVNYKNFCSFYRFATNPMGFQKYLMSAIDDAGLSNYCAKQLPPEAMEHLLNLLHNRGIYFVNMPPICTPSSTIVTPSGLVESDGIHIPVVS
jgi:18S rRNA (adenine1779-N6/adenine1780-N6)-dimethyltransferase